MLIHPQYSFIHHTGAPTRCQWLSSTLGIYFKIFTHRELTFWGLAVPSPGFILPRIPSELCSYHSPLLDCKLQAHRAVRASSQYHSELSTDLAEVGMVSDY